MALGSNVIPPIILINRLLVTSIVKRTAEVDTAVKELLKDLEDLERGTANYNKMETLRFALPYVRRMRVACDKAVPAIEKLAKRFEWPDPKAKPDA